MVSGTCSLYLAVTVVPVRPRSTGDWIAFGRTFDTLSTCSLYSAVTFGVCFVLGAQKIGFLCEVTSCSVSYSVHMLGHIFYVQVDLGNVMRRFGVRIRLCGQGLRALRLCYVFSLPYVTHRRPASAHLMCGSVGSARWCADSSM